jgi:hypothetical protein
MIFMEPNKPNVKLDRQGLIDKDVIGFEMNSEYSWITFGRSVSDPRLFIIYMVGTADKERKQGHATQLLNYFFAVVKKIGGMVKVESYTAAGEVRIRHVIERLAKKYNVRLIQ